MENSLKSLCGNVRKLLNSTGEMDEFHARGQKLLGDFINRTEFLKELMLKIATDDVYLKSRWMPTDPNEITLYRDKAGLFSLRLYIWDPAISYPVHSHGAWGVVSCVAGEIVERRYKRQDDGSKPGYAKISETGRVVLKPGETTTVLPLNEGIHRMGSNLDNQSSVSLHLYGRAERPGYLEFFNPHKDTSYRVFTPVYNNRVYALKALGAIQEEWSVDILKTASRDNKPYLRFEALRALGQIDKNAALKLLEQDQDLDSTLKEELAKLLR